MLLTKEDKLKIKVSSKFSTQDVNKAFAERLKALREIAGLTQSELADKLHVSRGSIGYYEKAERTPDIKFLHDVAYLFGVTFDFLLGESDSALGEDYQKISDHIDFSDRAIDKIVNEAFDNELLSDILECDEFDEVIFAIDKMMEYSKYPEIEYQEFLISKLFIEVLEKVRTARRVRAIEALSPEEKEVFFKALDDNEKEFNRKWEEYQRHLEESRRESEKRWEQLRKDEYNTPEAKVRRYFGIDVGGEDNGNNTEEE